MRKILLVGAALALVGADPAPRPARAGPDWCKLYCESIRLGCRATVGRIDQGWCEEFYEGCKTGCDVRRE